MTKIPLPTDMRQLIGIYEAALRGVRRPSPMLCEAPSK
jgi:hypothetical protein